MRLPTWVHDLFPDWDNEEYVLDLHRRKHGTPEDRKEVTILYVRGEPPWAVPVQCPHCFWEHPNVRKHLEAVRGIAEACERPPF